MASLLPTDRERSPLLAGPPRRSARLVRALPRAASAVARRTAFYQRTLAESRAFKPWCDARYHGRLARHADRLPELSAQQRELLDDVHVHGVAVREFALPAAAQPSADAFVDLLRRTHTDDPCVKATPRELGADPTLFLAGLAPDLLDLAEAHLGLPPRYLGLEVKRELVDAPSLGRHGDVRRWHLDHEDRRMFKVIVYLGDVDDGCGPFGYVARSNTPRVRRLNRRHHDSVSDDGMATVVPREDWKRVTGPRMTAIYADTGDVYHRVFAATTSERFSVTFAYSSRTPYYTYSRLMLPRRTLRRLRAQLSPRQWAALCVPELPRL